MHDVDGYEHHEIAEILGCSVGNSKSQLHKARLSIRESLLKNKKTNKHMKHGELNGRPRPIYELSFADRLVRAR
jgi:hypothetical protein